MPLLCFFFNDTATTEIYTLSLHDALPLLHGLNGEVDGPVRGDDDHRHLPVLLPDLPEHVQTAGAGHDLIDQHEVGRGGLKPLQGLGATRGSLDGVPTLCQLLLEEIQVERLVVDDEDLVGHGARRTAGWSSAVQVRRWVSRGSRHNRLRAPSSRRPPWRGR